MIDNTSIAAPRRNEAPTPFDPRHIVIARRSPYSFQNVAATVAASAKPDTYLQVTKPARHTTRMVHR